MPHPNAIAREKGIALPIVIILIVVAVIVYLLVRQGTVKLPTTQKEPAVQLQTQYQNPFDKSAQYVNPFSSYKNPFDNLR